MGHGTLGDLPVNNTLGSHHPVCSLQTQSIQLNKDMTLASNRSLAEGNLLYQPQLDTLKARLTQKYQELQVLFEVYQIKKTKLDKQSSSASLETLLALLQAEGAKIEEDTEVKSASLGCPGHRYQGAAVGPVSAGTVSATPCQPGCT